MPECDAVLNYNDGVDYYQDIAHCAGVHLEPIRSQSIREIEEQLDRVEEVKQNINNTDDIQRMNRLKNYLLEAKDNV